MERSMKDWNERRRRWYAVGALAVATALVGTAARGKGSAPVSDPSGRTFAASPSRPVSFSGTLDRTAVMVGGPAVVRMELVIGAEGGMAHSAGRTPTDLVVILDRSGSMAGDKIENARTAIRELVSRLGPADRFALVDYSNTASLAIGPAAAVDSARESWIATVATIVPEGGTNMSSGLDLGLDTIDRMRASGRTSRAILISDGLANQGDSTPEGLLRRAGRAARGEYVLTTVGVGADFNEYLMSALADAGTGNYYYLNRSDDLGSVFAREFDAARETVASGVEVQITPAAGVDVVDAAGYPLERSRGAVAFRPGSLFVGQQRRIWVTLSVPNQAAGEHPLGRFALSYSRGAERSTLAFADTPRVASVAREEDFYAKVDVPAWTRSVVVDGFNKMQEEVAREVKAGRRDAAIEKVKQFRAETEPLNARLQSADVQKKLDSLGKLESDVAAVFSGEDQAARQNELSKGQSAAALDERRAGAKR
ncbi:MAG: VWA domain-containing protein [Candidatus Binatia bacterium]